MARSRRLVLVLLVLTVATLGVSSTYVAQQEYSLSVTPSVEIPDRTTEFNGEEYTITAIGRVQMGNEISVDAQGPSNTTYDVIVYNNDNDQEQFREVTGDGSVTFDTDLLSKGTGSYMVVIEYDGEFQAVHPVVVPAYGATQTAPAEATAGESIHVQANLTEYEGSESIESVEVVVANDDTDHRVDMTEAGDLSYEANVSTDSLSTGEYQVYTVVRGTETFEGNNEIIGISDAQGLTIQAESTSTQTATPGSGGGSTGGGSAGGAGASTTESPQPDSSPTSSSPTSTQSPSTASTTVPSPETPSPPQSTLATSTTEVTSDGVLDPNTEQNTATETNTTTTSTGGPLGAFPLLWIVLGLAILLIRD